MSDALLLIDGEMTIYQAAMQKDQLLGALAEGTGALNLDLSQVTEIDVAGLQLLMLVRREALRLGRQLRLVRLSTAVLDMFELAGVAAQFGVAPTEAP